MATDSNNYAQACIPKFDGDYEHWCMLMENLLRSKEYWSVIETGWVETTPIEALTAVQKKALEEMKLKDLKTKNYLFQSIDKSILKTIAQKDTAKQIWESMKIKYQGNARVQRAQLQILRRNFEVLEMKPGEAVTDYFSRVLLVANDMRNLGEDMTNGKIVEKILRTLTENFNYIVCSIEESNDINKLSVDELQSSLLVHEQKFRRHRSGDDQALRIYDDRFGSRNRGRSSFRGRGRGRGPQVYNKATVECFKCHKLGHFQYECPSLNREANYAELNQLDEMLLMAHDDLGNKDPCYTESNQEHANLQRRIDEENKGSRYTELNPEEERLLMVHAGLQKRNRNDVWFLDSGCSNHMCGEQGMFTNLDTSFLHSVKLGNNNRMRVIGKGNVILVINGVNHVLNEVYHVPELSNNLLSIGQLQENGLAILFKGGFCKIYHPERGLIIETMMSANRMFILLAETQRALNVPRCLQVDSMDLPRLWHKRFGHLSAKGLQLLQQKGMVRGFPHFKVASMTCTECFVGKQRRNIIPKKSIWRASQPLELIHADICGPISPRSNGGKRYMLCFIDDYSRKSWVYLLVEKSEAFQQFKAFHKLVEKEKELPLKCLRTDNGGEFNSKEFIDFCKQNGIKRQLTAAYTPQQNGVAERKNQTMMNMVRCLLADKKMPKSFWPEAVMWSCYVLNRCPSAAVKEVTPQEAWTGLKPTVEHFRVFGCVAHVHIPHEKRGKLDNRSFICILLGYSEETKGYRLYDPIEKRVVVSRDVSFEEEKEWDWGEKFQEQILLDLEWGVHQEGENEGAVETDSGEESEEVSSSEGQQSVRENEVTAEIAAEVEVEGNEDVTAVIERGNDETEGRTCHAPAWMIDYVDGEGLSEDEVYVMQMAAEDPVYYEEAVKEEKWVRAMDNEIQSIEKNNTWSLVDLPADVKKIGVKWVYKTKYNEDGEIAKHKARLVAKGYSQKAGIDYTEVFAPVARMDTVRMIISMAAQKGWKIGQFDVKSAFLHGELCENVYVEQPKGYIKRGKEQMVYKLHKALYGLKQAPRAWFHRIEAYFLKEGFQKCESEQTLFTKQGKGGKIVIVSVYVDDLIFTGDDYDMLAEFKSSMLKEFDMSDLGNMHFFLGIEVVQREDGIFICQRKYALEILTKFGMLESNEVSSPIIPGVKISKDKDGTPVDETYFKQLVGSLMYLTATRPDMMFVTCLVSRYMAKPTNLHLQTIKRALRYLKGTVSYGIYYRKDGNGELRVYTDSDYAGDVEDRKSTSGYVFLLNFGAVSWCSKKQPIVTLSTTEAEFVAAAMCTCQAIWIKRILKELRYNDEYCTRIWCDNSSTIKLSKNPVMHGRSKHIDVRYHFLRNLTKEGLIDLVHCGSRDQLADIMTKPLKAEDFQRLRNSLGVCDLADLS